MPTSPGREGADSRVTFPLVWVEGPVDVGNLSVRHFRRGEKTVPVATLRAAIFAETLAEKAK